MTPEEIKELEGDYEVCPCMNITLEEIIESIKEGNDTIEALGESIEAGTVCEYCQSKEMDEDEDRELHLDEIIAYVQNS